MRVYLDHAATTPMRAGGGRGDDRRADPDGQPVVGARLRPGRAAGRRGRPGARRRPGSGADPAEVVFTAGGTEADNLAVKGAYWARPDAAGATSWSARSSTTRWSTRPCWLAQTAGRARSRCSAVDGAGRLDLAALAAALSPRTAVVSVMWANNEIGTVQPVAEVAERARAARRGRAQRRRAGRRARARRLRRERARPAQPHRPQARRPGRGRRPARPARRPRSTAVQHGGGQERDVRSGTLDVVGAAGFAAAVDVAVATLEAEAAREVALREELFARIRGRGARRGPLRRRRSADPAAGCPGCSASGCPDAPGDAVVMLLDAAGVDASTGSACSAGVTAASHVLTAARRPGRRRAQRRPLLPRPHHDVRRPRAGLGGPARRRRPRPGRRSVRLTGPQH